MPPKFVFVLLSYILTVSFASISHIILNDLHNAFSMVANSTHELNQNLQKMFEFDKITPRIVFDIPANRGHLTHKLRMQHMDFAKPTYPKLTKTYMKNMKNKWTRLSANSEDRSVWGFSDITHPVIQQSDSKEYDNFSMTSVEESPSSEWQNNDIFIARANYPFGYSTKWNRGNLTEERSKRGVPALYSMIKCATNCNPAVFQGHGCFCGFLGNGLPVDGVDRCCQNHDKCYGQSKCIKFIEYFVPYLWKCYSGKPICANDHGIWGNERSCAAKLCECDLKLSYCLRKQFCPRRRASCSSSRARRIQNFLFVK